MCSTNCSVCNYRTCRTCRPVLRTIRILHARHLRPCGDCNRCCIPRNRQPCTAYWQTLLYCSCRIRAPIARDRKYSSLRNNRRSSNLRLLRAAHRSPCRRVHSCSYGPWQSPFAACGKPQIVEQQRGHAEHSEQTSDFTTAMSHSGHWRCENTDSQSQCWSHRLQVRQKCGALTCSPHSWHVKELSISWRIMASPPARRIRDICSKMHSYGNGCTGWRP